VRFLDGEESARLEHAELESRLEREGRHLHASERIGDALQTEDHLTLHPNIDAGRGA